MIEMQLMQPVNPFGIRWIFNGPVGSTGQNDLSGRYPIQSTYGSATIREEGDKRFLYLDGSSWWTLPHDAYFNVDGDDFLIEVTFRVRSHRSWFPLFSKTVGQTGGYSYALAVKDGRLEFYWSADGTHTNSYRITGGPILSLNTWYKGRIERRDGALVLYLDEVVIASYVSATIHSSTLEISIGGANFPFVAQYNGHGDIAQIHYWKKDSR